MTTSGNTSRPFKLEVYTDRGRRMTYSYPTMEDASASASEKFAASNVSKVVLMKDGTKLKVWS